MVLRKTILPRVEDHTQQRMVERADADERSRLSVPLLDGRSLDVSVGAVSTARVGHNLGYAPRGYIVTKCAAPGPGTLYLSAADSGSITLGNSHATATLALTIWIY